MKRRIIIAITVSFSLFILLSVVLFIGMTYPELRDVNEASNVNRIKTKMAIVENKLENSLNGLVREIDYLGKDISYKYEIDKYLLQDYRKNKDYIEGVYLFNQDRELASKSSIDDQYDSLIENELEEVFFYNQSVWLPLDDDRYIVFVKLSEGAENYLGAIIKLSSFMSLSSDSFGDNVQVLNNFGETIFKTGSVDELSQNNQEKVISSLLNGNENTVHIDEKYYSFTKIDYKALDLYLLVSSLDQEYRWRIRNYVIKAMITAVLLLTFGFLIAWRLNGKIYRIFITTTLSNNYKSNEFVKIDKELKKAIHWIDDVVNHYNELNELKEELMELSKKLPKEGDFTNAKITKKHKS